MPLPVPLHRRRRPALPLHHRPTLARRSRGDRRAGPGSTAPPRGNRLNSCRKTNGVRPSPAAQITPPPPPQANSRVRDAPPASFASPPPPRGGEGGGG